MYYLRFTENPEIILKTSDMRKLVELVYICFESGYDVEIKKVDGGMD